MAASQITERSSAAIALLLVQLAIGYEWLVSGLTKIAHGDFASGLAAWAADHHGGWYARFLAGVVEPHARLFGYAIEWAELAVGIVLVLYAFAALSGRVRIHPALDVAAAVALAAGLVLAVNFELADRGGFGLHLGSDSFDEGVDLDTIVVALQLALLVPIVRALRLAR